MENCSSCNLKIRKTDKSLKCDICDKLFHPSCQDIDSKLSDSLNELRNKTGIAWFCTQCKTLDPLKLLKLIPGIAEQQTKLQNDFNILREQFLQAKTIVSGKSEPINEEEILQELESRRRNEERIVVSGLQLQKDKEKEQVVEFIRARHNMDVVNEIRHVHCITKPNKPPITFIHFDSKSVRNDALLNENKFKKQKNPGSSNKIYVNPAYTKKQMSQLMQLKQEAKDKSTNGKVFFVRNFRIFEWTKKN